MGFPIINATEGGARINNMEERSLEELISSLRKPGKSPGELLEEILSRKHDNDPERLYNEIISSIDSV